MSFFYLGPAKGTIPYHVLQVIVLKRLEHLSALFTDSEIDYNEYVIEGSIYDNIGHYTLCIAAILGRETDVYHFILNSEATLFKHRIELLSAYDLRCFARKLLKHIRKHDLSSSYLKPLQNLCYLISLKHISQHLRSNCDEKCTVYNIEVKFVNCLPFISRRCIELSNGIGKIPCNKWTQYLVILFSLNLKQRLKSDLDYINCDPRIVEIVDIVKSKLSAGKLEPNVLKSEQVDEVSKWFPPCMLNLHLQLRKRHRLSHEQRFNYSLFLKDIGMPVKEAIEFWKTEYSKHPDSHACCHSWANDEKKFIYGIRHMFGLEGGRKSYSCRNCNQIQGVENSTSEGGCPFKSFENQKMIKLLGLDEENELLSQIYGLKRRQQFSKACLLYLDNKYNRIVNVKNISCNLTPVKYYEVAIKNKN